MLSRTAESLFWLARYTERAGNTARGLGVALRMASVASGPDDDGDEWLRLLTASGVEAGFAAKYGPIEAEMVVHWLVHDPENNSSIHACIDAARRNARAVRTALTVDMWEALNDTWNRFRDLEPAATEGDRLPDFLGWVRERVSLFDGAAYDTMLRNEAWHFVHLGTMLERADNTARLLDAKHDLMTPGATGGDSVFAHVQWQAVLRSVAALRAYAWVFHERLDPRRVADLLIFRAEMPRSLMACLAEVAQTLDAIAQSHGGRRGECHRLAGEIEARLRFGRIDTILAGEGLHEFLTTIIEHTAELGARIEDFYIRP